MDALKHKTPVIRATQPQTDLLKAAYSVSSAPLPQALRELSEQTGLPEKWISNWFGRQRSKSRKAKDKATGASATLKTEHQEVQLESDPAPSPRSAVQELPEPIHKPVRRRAPRAKKANASNPKSTAKPEPKEILMPSMPAAPVPLGRPLPSPSSVTSSIVRDQSQSATLPAGASIILPATTLGSAIKSVQPKLGSNCRQIGSTRIQQGPIMRSDFRHTLEDDYSLDSDAATCPEKTLDLDSQRPSSPTSSEVENSITNTHSEVTIALTSCNEPFTSAAQAAGRINLTQQALIALFNEDPAAYRAMLLPYAMLFPALFPALAEAVTVAPPRVIQPSAHSFSAEYNSASFSDDGPWLPSYTLYNEDLPPSSPPATDDEFILSPWISGSDHLDFSALSHQDAPLYHLRERLEPFRLPESEYLFGREGVANYLLDDRLSVEEPFHAAMGLVLLSKLGLQW